MRRKLLIGLFFFPLISRGGQIPIPKGIQVGADFIWYLAMGPKAPFRGANLNNDPQFLRELGVITKSLESWRHGLERNVEVIIQRSLSRGEELTIFSIYSKYKGSRYFELHILGLSTPPTIAGIKERSRDEVINILSKSTRINITPG